MKKFAITAYVLVFGLTLLSSSFAKAANVYGVFRVVKGSVQVKNSKGQTTKARIGQKIFPNEIIITAKDSRAKIVMVDKNIINVSPNSEVVFEKYEYDPAKNKKDVLINVIYGKVRSKVTQKYDEKDNKFRVKTPSAVAGVRGTDFFTSFDRSSKSTRIVTFEGEVKYGVLGANGSIANAVSVRAGQMASNRFGAPPTPPAPVPKNMLSELDIDSNADSTPTPGLENNTINEDRVPAETPDAPPTDDSAANSAAPPTSPENQEGPPSRDPANVAPNPGSEGSMLLPQDIVGGGGNGGFVPSADFIDPSLSGGQYFNPDQQRLPGSVLPVCQFCDRVTESGKTRLIINVTQ